MKAIYLVSILFVSFYFNVFASSQKNITFLIAEREYNTKETLPKFIKQHLSKNFSIKFCNAPNKGEKRNQLSNSSAIREADLLFISVRRRAFKEETMKLIRLHILKGKPVIGIRTASHAFELRKEILPDRHQEWPEWDRDVIGGNYNGHHATGLICNVKNTMPQAKHSILQNVEVRLTTPATLYRNSPLPDTSKPLLVGSVEGFPPEPVAWFRRPASKGKIFYTSLGHMEDFENPAFIQLLINAINWCLENN